MQPTNPIFIDVTYYPNVTVYGALPARLEWTANNRLKLTTVEGTQQAPIYKEVFNLSPGEVIKVKSMMDEIKFFTASGKFRISVAQYSGPAIAIGGLPGVAAAYDMYEKSGADEWIQRLKQNGVRVTRIGYGATVGFALLGAVALLAIIFIIYLITEVWG